MQPTPCIASASPYQWTGSRASQLIPNPFPTQLSLPASISKRGSTANNIIALQSQRHQANHLVPNLLRYYFLPTNLDRSSASSVQSKPRRGAASYAAQPHASLIAFHLVVTAPQAAQRSPSRSATCRQAALAPLHITSRRATRRRHIQLNLHRQHGDHFRILPATATPQSSSSAKSYAGSVFVNSKRQCVYYFAKPTTYAPAALSNFAPHVPRQPVRPTSKPESARSPPADALHFRRLRRTRNAWVWAIRIASSSNGNSRRFGPTLLWYAKSEHCHVSRRQSRCAQSSVAATRRYATANATT